MEILILFLLILLNGVFAMSEIAMVSSKKARLESAARKGDRTAKKALELSRNPSKFFSTIQIGITLIGILTGIYSGEKIEDDLTIFLNRYEMLQPYAETLSIIIIVIVLTFFSLVLGELVPKRIGLTMPETMSKVLSYPMYWISILAAPFIWLLTLTTDLIIKILNIKKSREGQVTEEEIKAIVREATETGVVQEIEQDIVENVFHLGDRKIKTLMTPCADIEFIDLAGSPEMVKKTIINSPHKSFPAFKGHPNNIIGVLHSKEMLNALLSSASFEIEKALKPALYLTEKTSAYQALEKLRETKQRVALVIDESGSVQGILSMNDLINALVGDFTAELHEKKEIIPRDDGSFLVDAALPLPEFTRYFDIDLTGDDSLSAINTVEGLIYHFAKKIPHTGYAMKWKHLTIEVIDMDGRRIDKILVRNTLVV